METLKKALDELLSFPKNREILLKSPDWKYEMSLSCPFESESVLGIIDPTADQALFSKRPYELVYPIAKKLKVIEVWQRARTKKETVAVIRVTLSESSWKKLQKRLSKEAEKAKRWAKTA